MRTSSRRRLDSQVNVRVICTAHSDAFAGNDTADKALAQLDASSATVTGAFDTDTQGREKAKIAGKDRRTLRAIVRECCKRIVETGRVVARALGMQVQFDYPRKGNDRLLIADAKDIAARALPLVDTFVAHKLPANVITDLPAHIAALDQAMQDQALGRETRVAAKAAIRAGLESGGAAMDVLEPIFFNAVNLDPEKVTLWKSARRVGPARVRTSEPSVPPPAPVKSVVA